MSATLYDYIPPTSEMTSISSLYNLLNISQYTYFNIFSVPMDEELIVFTKLTPYKYTEFDNMVGLYNTRTNSVLLSTDITSISASAPTRPRFTQDDAGNYYLIFGADNDDNSINIVTNFDDVYTATYNKNEVRIYDVRDTEMVYGKRSVLSSIDVETKSITRLSAISNAIPSYVSVVSGCRWYIMPDHYVCISTDKHYKAYCVNKHNNVIDTTVNIQDLTDKSGQPLLGNANSFYIDIYKHVQWSRSPDESCIYVSGQVDLYNTDDEMFKRYFILCINPHDITKCGVVPESIRDVDYEWDRVTEYKFISTTPTASATPTESITVLFTDMRGYGSGHPETHIEMFELDNLELTHINNIDLDETEKLIPVGGDILQYTKTIDSAIHPYIYSIMKPTEYIGLWERNLFLRMRLLGYF